MFQLRRHKRAILTELNDPDALITPAIGILETGPVPQDNLNVTTVPTVTQSGSKKILDIIDAYTPFFEKIETVDCAFSAITIKVPKQMITDLISTLNAVQIGCKNKVAQAIINLQTLNLDVDTLIPVTRGIIDSLKDAFNELEDKEQSVNISTALIDSLSRPVGTFDLASAPSNSALTNMVLEIENSPLTTDDINDVEGLEIDDLNLEDVFNEVISENPNAVGQIGVGSNTPSTILLNDDSDPPSVYEQSTVQAIEGLKSLFHASNLLVPLSELLERLDAIPVWKEITVGEEKVTVLAKEPIPTEDIDLTKSILDQDLVVTVVKRGSAHRSVKIADRTYFTVQNALELEVARHFGDDTLFLGVKSGKLRTQDELRSFSSTMGKIWNKMKNVSFPSLNSVQTGVNVLSMGLGAIGSLTGKTDLCTASNYLNVFNEGLTAFKFSNTRATNEDTTQRIWKVMLTSFPSLIKAGSVISNQILKTTTRQLRKNVAEKSKSIVAGFEQPPTAYSSSRMLSRLSQSKARRY